MTMIDGEASTAQRLDGHPLHKTAAVEKLNGHTLHQKAAAVLEEDALINTEAEAGPVNPERLQTLVKLANELLASLAESIQKNPNSINPQTVDVMVRVLNVAQLRIASTGARVRITPTQPNYDQQLDQSVNRLKKTKNP
ncbi:hypothetical protein KA078_03170, partial [Candidatus Woesebacteria bacterium]|nr:hypothetical protein [Candidatus Woesebacteria bacterium]